MRNDNGYHGVDITAASQSSSRIDNNTAQSLLLQTPEDYFAGSPKGETGRIVWTYEEVAAHCIS